MRVLIVTAGSLGDVAPFTGLGVRLRLAGHQVALAAHDRFADLVRACGLEYRALPGDPVALVRARTAAPSPEDAHTVFTGFLDELGEGVVAATAAGTDVLLTAFGPAPLSRLVAQSAGIPSMGVYLVPGLLTREFALPGSSRQLSPADNHAAGRALLARAGSLHADVLARLRARLDLPPVTEERASPPDNWPICHGYSPSVLPRPTDWPASAHVTGYWWPERPPGWAPPSELADFLDAGPPPVFVGFGSMIPDHARLHEVVATAIARAGVRAVVQSGWAELGFTGDDILCVEDLPHDWLFPRMAAVVHHAGAGTTGAGLRAGVPAVPVPVLVDQPFWADRLHRLGVAPPPLPLPDLTAGTLAAALRACLDRPSYRDRAAGLGRRVRAEDGAAAVLSLLTRLDPAAAR
ncbi:glycosyltransferase [Pseudonocardia spinosispora]|uniref:glycosyltransferase n=1 Tax=Pseudonocardia spinosispora TaxID=103441 RepID=UPI0003FEA992|nr:glycosyltransferase [Pseudonocardia spinosispora]